MPTKAFTARPSMRLQGRVAAGPSRSRSDEARVGVPDRRNDTGALLQLQRTAGNRAVIQLMRTRSAAERSRPARRRPDPPSGSIPAVQRELLAYSKEHTEFLSPGGMGGGTTFRTYSADAPKVRAALEPLIKAGKLVATSAGDQVWFAERGATSPEIEAALSAAGFATARLMAASLVDGHNVYVYANSRVTKMTSLFGSSVIDKKGDVNDRQTSRLPTDFERREAKLVFGSSLDLDKFRVIEDPVMTVGGYARTVPSAVYMPPGSLNRSGIMPWLIHEFTHAWQYQHGVSVATTLIEAIRARYDYGGESQLVNDRKLGKRFTDYTTEQQADIASDYYEAVKAGRGTSAFKPYIDELRDPTGAPAPPNRSPVLDLNDRLLNDAKIPMRKAQVAIANHTCDPVKKARLEEDQKSVVDLVAKVQGRIDKHPSGSVDATTRKSIDRDVDAAAVVAVRLQRNADAACAKKTACLAIPDLPIAVASTLGGALGGASTAFGAAFGPAVQTSRASAPSDLTGLKRGDGLSFNGPGVRDRVKSLQEALNLTGAALTPDGMFGSGTGRALMDFQSSRGLPRREFVDEHTADVVSSASPDDLIVTVSQFEGLKRGDGLDFGTWDRRPRVKGLQQRLTALGFPAKPDGMFGPGTQTSLNGFQATRGIPPGDTVDVLTAEALEGRTPGQPAACPAGEVPVDPAVVSV